MYISDVIVPPDYQGKGYGRRIMEKLMSVINKSMKPGEKIMINFMAASGKEDFYQKFGSIKRPNDTLGCGMCRWVEYGKQ
ncbi:MAG: GNAT family N-acetyltransferase [Saccharofermentans sp.]|nr:GNAT family N-acetyltransferase [Saccharofermentans sp.]